MAVKVNAASENSGGSSKLYTGVCAVRVTHVNPTQDELKSLGYKAEKAPVYKDDKNGQRVVFIVEGTAPGGDKIKTNVAFFLKEKKQEDIWVNKQGNYGKDREKITGEVRNPWDGELDLIRFISDWGNVKKDDECYLDTIDHIVTTGDVSELRGMVKALSEGFVKLFLTISQDGKYQRVYMRKFMRAYNTDFSYLHKDLVKNKDYIKEELGGVDLALYIPDQFKLKVWEKGGAMDNAAPASTGVSPSVSKALASTGSDDDEAPF